MQEILLEQALEIEVRPGDVQFISNLTCVHGKRAYDHTGVPPEERRCILRTWLDLPGGRPLADPYVNRFGVGRFGKYCWSAEEILAGAHVKQRQPRRPQDGAPIRVTV
jgi:hypothetical protein